VGVQCFDWTGFSVPTEWARIVIRQLFVEEFLEHE
jgi:hypothetical protein